MSDWILLVNEVGFPILASAGLAYFIWFLIGKIVNNMLEKIDMLDDKLQTIINSTEERLSSKLDSQHGIIIALVDRVRSLDNETLRTSVLIKTLLKMPDTIEVERLDKADLKHQRKD
jgi:hypothetical protein